MKQSLSPKSNFLKTESAKTFQELVTKPFFLNAVSVALLEYQQYFGAAGESVPRAALDYQRLIGAKEFVHVLLNISEQPEERPTTQRQNLKHDNNPSTPASEQAKGS